MPFLHPVFLNFACYFCVINSPPMVEVFKTDVDSTASARRLAAAIMEAMEGCRANFDLEDCDRILRVCTDSGTVDADAVIALVRKQGYSAAVLEDIVTQSITS